MKVKCDYCGKEFDKPPSVMKITDHNFCMREHYHQWKRERGYDKVEVFIKDDNLYKRDGREFEEMDVIEETKVMEKLTPLFRKILPDLSWVEEGLVEHWERIEKWHKKSIQIIYLFVAVIGINLLSMFLGWKILTNRLIYLSSALIVIMITSMYYTDYLMDFAGISVQPDRLRILKQWFDIIKR